MHDHRRLWLWPALLIAAPLALGFCGASDPAPGAAAEREGAILNGG